MMKQGTAKAFQVARYRMRTSACQEAEYYYS
jgi:hypothetical protein